MSKLEKYISDHSVVPNDSQIGMYMRVLCSTSLFQILTKNSLICDAPDDLVFHEMLNIEERVYQNEIEREKSLDKIPRFFFKV